MPFTKVAPAGIGTEPGDGYRIGDSFLHSTGINLGSGTTISHSGSATFTGIITAANISAASSVTATEFYGDGSNLDGVSSSGIGTPLSDDDTSDLNKVYYVNQELSIGSTVTVNHPSSAVASYTHYQDLVVKNDADFIVSDGDTFIPDVLGIRTSTSTASAATGGRIRAGTITNAGANGAPNFPNGLTGTAGTFTGAITAASGTITGNLGVAGVLTYEDVTNIDSVGIITARSGINVSSGSSIGIGTDKPSASLYVHESNIPQGFTAHTDTAICAESSTNANIEIATGHNSTGALYFSDTGATAKGKIEYLHGSSGDLMTFQTNGSEKLRIGSAGQIGIAGANYGTSGQVLTSQGASSAVQWATPSGGISDFDTWYLTSDLTGNTNPIVNNWSRWDRYGGTGTVTFAAPSSGIWTFPSTGYWKIEYVGRFRSVGNNSERGCNASIYVTTNNSSYSFATQQSTNLHKASDNTNISRGHTLTPYIFDVTSTSTHKMKVDVGYQQAGNVLEGHGAYLYTHIRFMKLKDT